MSNPSTPRHKVGTVKSLLKGYFDPDYKPTADDVRGAIQEKKRLAAERGKPLNIHHDGRLFMPYQRMTKLPKIGKGNEGRV